MVSQAVKTRVEQLALLPAGERARRALAAALAVVALFAVLVVVWPLGLKENGAGDSARNPTSNVAWPNPDDEAWRTRSLRAPLGSTDFDPPPYQAYADDDYENYDADPQVVLVGLSYRTVGESLAFLRFSDGIVRVLAVGEEHEGLRLTALEHDHVMIGGGAAPQRLDLLTPGPPPGATPAPPAWSGVGPPMPGGDR